MNIASTLTQKIGPLPAWAWGGLAAVGVWYFLLRGKATGATGNAAAAGSQLSSGYGLGYAQGLQAAGPLATSATTGGKGTVRAGSSNPGLAQAPYSNSQIPLYATGADPSNPTYGAHRVGLVPFGTSLTVTGPSTQVPWGTGQSTLLPVNYLGSTYYVSVDDVTQTAGIGGARRSIGSRSANLWHHSHPLIGARVPYQYHVRAVGGAPNHAREVHRVALQAGVHPARLMALNPTPTGYIRVA